MSAAVSVFRTFRAGAYRVGVCLCVVAALALTLATDGRAAHLECGQVVTTSVRLDSDLLDCLGDGLIVGADGITINLNRHAIRGTDAPWAAGVRIDGYDNITVTNGEIGYFNSCIAGTSTHGSVFTKLRMGGDLPQYGGSCYEGIAFRTFASGVIANSLIHASHGNIWFTGDDNQILNNHFPYGDPAISISGSRTTISGNTIDITGPTGGINVRGAFYLISSNVIRGGGEGAIQLRGADSSTVRTNKMPHGGWRGILLDDNSDGNVVSGNALDHYEYGIVVRSTAGGNTLEGNSVLNSQYDGILVSNATTRLTRNIANFNGLLGINAENGALDGGGNRAKGNGDPLQCFGVVCK